ncbi:MAG: hypothetical protein ABII74_01595, partial [Elusimicrobiota bacterium]
MGDYNIELATAAAPGIRQFYRLGALEAGTTYYLIIWTSDEAGNWSNDSNLAFAAAYRLPTDQIAPKPPFGVKLELLDRAVRIKWSIPKRSEDGRPLQETVYYNIYRSENLSGPYERINSRLVTVNEYDDYGYDENKILYYHITGVGE